MAKDEQRDHKISLNVVKTNDNDLNYEVLKGAVENTNEAFVTIDQRSTVLFFNKAAEELFGFSRSEVIGRDLGMILGPMCVASHREAVKRYVKTREPVLIGHESELQVLRKNGSTFPASISFSVAEVAGKLFFTGIIRDLTEKKALEEKLLQSERLAALGQAVAEISHEIKNPLLMIGGFARQIHKKTKNAKDRDKLRIITEEVDRLENLLLEMKDLYRPRQLQFARINIDELLAEIVSLVSDEASSKSITIKLTAENETAYAMADREKLKQVLLNLVKNSMEALPQGGDIQISTKTLDDRVEILITDRGEGIPAEIREKIFSPFFTTKEHGTGLGLCISKSIINEHPGSSFTLESREGEGTVVTIGLACDKI